MSVLKQTHTNVEVLVIDDASTDDTEEVLSAIDDIRVKYHRMDFNVGGGAARNAGIQMSQGEFIAFLDSDDEWVPQMLELCLGKAKEKDVSNVIFFGKLILDNKKYQRVYPRQVYTGDDLSEYMFCRGGLVSTITLFMATATARSVMFDSKLRIHQDYDFVLRAYNNGILFEMIDEVLAIWHNDDRDDRMGRSKRFEDSYNWVSSNEQLFSHKAIGCFIRREVAGIASWSSRPVDAVLFFKNLYRKDELSTPQLCYYILKLYYHYLKIYKIFRYR